MTRVRGAREALAAHAQRRVLGRLFSLPVCPGRHSPPSLCPSGAQHMGGAVCLRCGLCPPAVWPGARAETPERELCHFLPLLRLVLQSTLVTEPWRVCRAQPQPQVCSGSTLSLLSPGSPRAWPGEAEAQPLECVRYPEWPSPGRRPVPLRGGGRGRSRRTPVAPCTVQGAVLGRLLPAAFPVSNLLSTDAAGSGLSEHSPARPLCRLLVRAVRCGRCAGRYGAQHSRPVTVAGSRGT